MEALPLVQILDEHGNLVGDESKLGLNNDDYKYIFENMLKVRLFEDRCMKLQRQGRIGFYIGAYGQEASTIGTGYAFKKQDWLFPSYRCLGLMLMRGASVQAILDQIFGNADDNTFGAQMPCHQSFRDINFVSISSPIGTQIPQAVGAAMAAKYKKDDVVVATYMGEGGTSEGDFHVALNFAGVYKAPVVFIVENNQWAISCPSSEQTASKDFAMKAHAYGFEGVKVDGNDPLAVYKVTKDAADKARNGGGATFIETVTYRLFSHSSSDDRSRYCPEDEYNEALKKEPFIRFRKFLGERDLWSESYEKEISEKFNEEVSAAVKAAEKKPRPEISTLFERVTKSKDPLLEEQQRMLNEELKERKSWEDEGAFPL